MYYTQCVSAERCRRRNSIRNGGGKKEEIPATRGRRAGNGNGNTYMSFRSMATALPGEYQYRISADDILLASPVTPESEAREASRSFLPSVPPRRPLSSSLSLSHPVSLSAARPLRPLANCHFTDSLFCENRLHSDSNEASFTPCHASYTP